MVGDMESTQLAVIGGGPGGYAAAFLAADLGLEVTLIDLEPNPGGVCLYRGCIPSKALLHVAKVINEAREADAWGVSFSNPRIDLSKVRAWKDQVIGKLTGGLGQLSRQRKISYIQGQAGFIDSRTLQLKKQGGEIQLKFQNAILATGSYPAVLPNISLDSPRLLDSTSALEIQDIPKSLLVIGGGYIGLEMATVYASLGSQVTVVEMSEGLLPGVDRDLVSVLSKRIERILHQLLLNTKVVDLKEEANGIRVRLEGAEEKEALFEKVLIAIGRKPNSAIHGIEHTQISVNERGFIQVDHQRRTTDPAIFAIGDVAGAPMLAHKASHEGRVAAEVIAGRRVFFEPQAIPAVIFTDPEIAWCGLTETEAKQQGQDIQVIRFPWAASGRAMTLHRADGVTKLIIDSQTERVLGAGIVGAGAGELIAELVLAIEMAAVVSDIKLSIHPHPTLSETVMEAAEVFFGQSTHLYRPARK
ncbi:dihydrolipoamide dehydrogenase [Candidatus Nitrosoglobus terrae]|uniref:Dihydrolipoyl dehydrogenase n=1 Tax=Candidatus Nitrosoglobus terrae TaxID=1630141 RepID=A0A1Q2SNL3_9GAMM|nr:dihydrolipoyl dehydrogenase [Candidatus Nitrosoglobus terrae]BAW80689.1 dihydrolipoamide dehydrogenase [Candidatus Nitrosoglobus terrae]